jgi:stage II sporulation protein D
VPTGTIGPWPRRGRSPIVDPVLMKPLPRAARRPTLAVITSAFAAAALLFALSGTSVLGATTLAAACDGVNLRTGPSTGYAIKTSVKTGTTISVVATVTGGSWSAVCGGKAVAGSGWYRISAVNGKTVSSLYGVTYLYGATGLFKAVTVPPPPTPTPSPGSGPTTLGPTVTFFGRGYGHGVGLSQAGAYGRATAGQSAATILAHYYPGTIPGTTPNAQIRVLVLSGWQATATSPLQLYGRGGTWTFDGIAKVFPADAHVRLIPAVSSTTTTWTLVVDAVDGTNLYRAATSGNLRMRPATSATRLQLFSKPTTYDRYRGVLRIIVAAGAKVSVVNEVPLDSYLRGVLPAEMSPSAPTEALKAQAVASRSYAAYRLHPTTGTYDVYDDTRSQVYRGVLAEKTATTAAVTGTAGQVLRYGTAIANTFYHSTGGGATESNQNVWVSATGAITSSPIPYLQGSLDRAPDGSSYDAAATYATWQTATYTLAQVQAFLAADTRTNVGSVVALDLSRRGVARLISVTLIGADGTTKTVSAAVFDAVFNAHRPAADPPIRSTLFALAPIP